MLYLSRRELGNGERYEGQWVAGACHGEGRYVCANGDEYSGEWHRGQRSGRGVMCFADGTRFEGGYAEGVERGFGLAWGNAGDNEGLKQVRFWLFF